MENRDGVMELATAYMPPVAFWVAAMRQVKAGLAEAAVAPASGGVSATAGATAASSVSATAGGVLRLCKDERYCKQTYRNRAVILSAQGEQRLSVPVSCPYGPHTRTENVRINYGKAWQRDHWRSLCTAYNNSPYFLYYRDELEAILVQMRHERLWDLNLRLMEFFIKAFGLNWTVEAASVQAGAVEPLAFSDKTPELWQRFAPSVAPENYQNTFMQAVACPARLSGCDLLFNYGPQAKALFA